MNTHSLRKKMFSKAIKQLALLLLLISTGFTTKAQTTYYWVHNQTAQGGTNLNDMITISGTTYWRHLSTVSGGTLAAQLTPTASVSFAGMGNDEIVIDNNSFTYTTTANVSIYFNTNITVKNIISTGFTGGTGGFTQLNYLYLNLSGTTTTIRQNILMTSDAHLNNIGVHTGIVEVSPPAGATATVLMGQRPFLILGTFRVRTNATGGVVNFNDFIKTTNSGGNFLIQANTPADATNSIVNFNQPINLNVGMNINSGRVNFKGNVASTTPTLTAANGTKYTQPFKITIGNTAAGTNGFTHVVFNANDTTEAGGLAPLNKFSKIVFDYVTGYACFKNVVADTSALYSQTKNSVYPGGPTTNVDTFLTNQKTKFTLINTNYGNNQGVMDWRTAAYLKGTYIFDGLFDAIQQKYVSCPNINMLTFKDTVKVKCNALLGFRDGWPFGALYNGYDCVIDKDAVMKLDSGNVYDFNCLNYMTNSGYRLNVKGKLYVGGIQSCATGGKTTVLKYADINFNFPAGNPRFVDMKNTQLIATRAVPESPFTFKSIDASNSDMGSNLGWGIGGVGYGTFPYNTIPYTGNTARTLLWNSTTGTDFWGQNKWYNVADLDGIYNDCPPTYIDSVVVLGGSTLSIDTRFAQCKTLWFQGATSTLKSRNLVTDSANTLEIFGSLIIDNTLNNRFYRNINFRAWQSYPIIKTSGTYFHRGLAFRSINTAAVISTTVATVQPEVNNGK